MTRFSNVREAKEFLVSTIVAEAQREGVPVSEIERKMLYFSETGWTLPDMMEVNDEFDREYDQAKYERKIALLIRNVTKRLRKENPADLNSLIEAIRKLRKEDHYILVMVDAAGVHTGSVSDDWKIGLLVAIGICFIFVLNAIWGYLGLWAPRANGQFGSATIDERRINVVGYLYVSFLAFYLCCALCAHFDPKRRLYKIFDSMLDPIVNGVFKLFRIDEK